jgi:Zn-dependent peptidase ImmA (M78 family)/transcriptional regulator with XRE-family HTH domain
MGPLAALLREARDAAALDLRQLASWAHIEAEHLEAIERGRAEPSWSELDRCARVFGLRVDDLLDGQGGQAPMTLLLRSTEEQSGASVRDDLTAESCERLGEFQRVLRDIADLERELGRERPTLRTMKDSARPGLHPGERRALAARKALGLGKGAIGSMVHLLHELGVAIVWSRTAARSLDGACARSPMCGVLVVLDEGPPTPWRTRMTLAHELCHLLFDLGPERPVLLSPSAVRGAYLQQLERTARAFAAHLLAPSEGVRVVVGADDPTSETSIGRVGAHFGVGRTVAINRLQQVFSLTDDRRMQMEHRFGSKQAQSYAADFSGDHPPEPAGLRGEPLYGLLGDALRARKIPPSRARRLLGLSPADALPFDELGPELCAPTVSPGDRALRGAFTYLVEHSRGLAR